MARIRPGHPAGIVKPVTPEERAAVAHVDVEPTEQDRRLEFIFRMMMRGYSETLMVRVARTELGVGVLATRNLIAEVRVKLRGDAEDRKPFARAEQIARVRDTIEKLKTPRFKTVRVKGRDAKGKEVVSNQQVEQPLPANAILRAEELLADLEGNRAPVVVQVEHTLKASAMALFASLPPERYDQLLERARERKRLAAASRTVEMPES